MSMGSTTEPIVYLREQFVRFVETVAALRDKRAVQQVIDGWCRMAGHPKISRFLVVALGVIPTAEVELDAREVGGQPGNLGADVRFLGHAVPA